MWEDQAKWHSHTPQKWVQMTKKPFQGEIQ